MGTSSPHTLSKQSTTHTNTNTNNITSTSTSTGTTLKTKSKSRSSNQKQNRLYTKALQLISHKTSAPALATAPGSGSDSVDVNFDDSLAICLLGFNSHKNTKTKMYDSEYEEEVRKQAVMQVSRAPPFTPSSFWVILPCVVADPF